MSLLSIFNSGPKIQLKPTKPGGKIICGEFASDGSHILHYENGFSKNIKSKTA